MVIGFVSDKSYRQILAILPNNAIYYFCQADIPRALPAELLKKEAAGHNLIGKAFKSVREGLESAKKNADADH